jgi:hypothetical protein
MEANKIGEVNQTMLKDKYPKIYVKYLMWDKSENPITLDNFLEFLVENNYFPLKYNVATILLSMSLFENQLKTK